MGKKFEYVSVQYSLPSASCVNSSGKKLCPLVSSGDFSPRTQFLQKKIDCILKLQLTFCAKILELKKRIFNTYTRTRFRRYFARFEQKCLF